MSQTPVTNETMQGLLSSAPETLTFVLRRGPRFDDPATAPLQWEHARNMFGLLRDGKVVQVTAIMDGTDVLGVGYFARIERAEAEAILAADPGIAGGRLTFELRSSVSFRASELQFT